MLIWLESCTNFFYFIYDFVNLIINVIISLKFLKLDYVIEIIIIINVILGGGGGGGGGGGSLAQWDRGEGSRGG